MHKINGGEAQVLTDKVHSSQLLLLQAEELCLVPGKERGRSLLEWALPLMFPFLVKVKILFEFLVIVKNRY